MSKNNKIHISEGDSGLVVKVPAALPRANCREAVGAIRGALRQNSGPVIIDLARVSIKDSYSVALAVEIKRLSKEHGKKAQVQNAESGLADLIAELEHEFERRTKPKFSFIGLPEQVGERTVSLGLGMRSFFEFSGSLCRSLAYAVLHPRRVRWGDVLIYMDRCGIGGLPIVLLICFLMGLILGFQAALQLQTFGADIYVANLVGLSVARELGPLMVAMIATGRAGSAFAAEIGTMQVSEEVDALRTMGLEPNRFLVVPKVLALIAVMPLLTICGDLAGIAGGFVVGAVQLDIPLVSYWHQTTATLDAMRKGLAPNMGARPFRMASTLGAWDILQGLVKSVVFALFIAAVGCLRGLQTRGGAQGVGSSTTAAVVTGIFCIIISDAAMTMIFARLGLG